jgi:hypothetical protein
MLLIYICGLLTPFTYFSQFSSCSQKKFFAATEDGLFVLHSSDLIMGHFITRYIIIQLRPVENSKYERKITFEFKNRVNGYHHLKTVQMEKLI